MTKTTLELPEELMQRVKLRALQRRQKLKDAIAQLLELGFAAGSEVVEQPRMPKAVRLKDGTRFSIKNIEFAIDAGRD